MTGQQPPQGLLLRFGSCNLLNGATHHGWSHGDCFAHILRGGRRDAVLLTDSLGKDRGVSLWKHQSSTNIATVCLE